MNTTPHRALTCTAKDAEALWAHHRDCGCDVELAIWWYDPKGAGRGCEQYRQVADFLRVHDIPEAALDSGIPVSVHENTRTGERTLTAHIRTDPARDGTRTTWRQREVTAPLATALPKCGHHRPPGAWLIAMGRFRKNPDMVTDEYLWEVAQHLCAEPDVHAAPNARG